MELVNFRFYVAFFSETLFVIPIFFAFQGWEKLNFGQKKFIYFLILNFFINVLSILFYSLGKRNHFGYYYSIAECLFLFQSIRFFLPKKYATIVHLINIICFFLICFDLFWLTGVKNTENVFSATIIHLSIFLLSTSYLISILTQDIKRKVFNELNLIISFSLMIIFFFKTIFSFLMRFLLETQTNFYIYMQIENIVNFFNIVSIIIVSLALYKNKIVNE